MNCGDLQKHLELLYPCRKDEDGLRIATSCLYPSFSQVFVFIVKLGDGYKVHDGGGAYACSWELGREPALIKRILSQESQRNRIRVDDGVFVADAVSAEWLPSAILSVANASAFAARAIIDHVVAAAEADLSEKIFQALRLVYPEPSIKREFHLVGNSGKTHLFDFAVGDPDKRILLLNAVSPHHSSIAHKYTAFSDVKSLLDGAAHGFAVFDRPLEADDASLMQQVADLVPVASVSAGARRVIP